jgi:drug/metabolite transporter (DMT)-like permease
LRPIEKGILLTLIAYSCYALAAFLIKITPLSSPLIVFFRNAIGLCCFLPFFLLKKNQLKTKRLPFHCLRTCLSLATIYCSTYGIQYLQLGDAMLLEQTAPLFILIILFFWRGEKISPSSLIAIFIAIIGVILILRPHFDLWRVSALASLTASFLVAISYLCIDSLSKTEPSLSILFHFLWISSLLSFVPSLGYWQELTSFQHLFLLLCIGILFACFQYLLNRAMVFASVDVVGNYAFLPAVFSVILGYFFLNEEFSLFRLLGCLLIIGAGVHTFYEKRKNVIKETN